jgi:hypothetical protein
MGRLCKTFFDETQDGVDVLGVYGQSDDLVWRTPPRIFILVCNESNIYIMEIVIEINVSSVAHTMCGLQRKH